jgi:hypothetical protein
MPSRAKGDPDWKNRPPGEEELSQKARSRVPLPANEQQHVDEFFDVLHALVYYRLGLRELTLGLDMTSGKSVPPEAVEDGKAQLARFDAQLLVCWEKLQGHSFLYAMARKIRQFQIDYEVRLLKAALMSRLADAKRFDKNFDNLFPTTTYRVSPDLVRLRQAIDAEDVQEPLRRRPMALDLAATRAVSHLRGQTVRVRSIKQAQSTAAKARQQRGVEPPDVRAEADWEVTLDGEPIKPLEWSDMIREARRKKKRETPPGD